MRTKALVILVALPLLGVVWLSGCSQPPGTIIREKDILEDGHLVTTDARQRAITTHRPDISTKPGVVVPSNITCVEPQPSVALALANGLGVGISIFQQGSGALSNSVSEGVFQMDERTIAIQALLNAGYQNCLDYSNGAITNTFYAIRASNLDSLLVTMTLASEAAGNLRSSLGSVGTQASSDAKASQSFLAREITNIQDSAKVLGDARKSTSDKRETLATKKVAASDATKARTDAEAAENQAKAEGKTGDDLKPFTDEVTKTTAAETKAKDEQAAAQKEFDAANAEEDAIENGMLNQIDTAASSDAATKEVRGAGGIVGRPTDTAVLTLGEMQRRFVERSTASQNITACLVELGLATKEPQAPEAVEKPASMPEGAVTQSGAQALPQQLGVSSGDKETEEVDEKPDPIAPQETFERDFWEDVRPYLKDQIDADGFGQDEANVFTLFSRSERDSQLAQFCKEELPAIVTAAQADEQVLALQRVRNERLRTVLQLLQSIATLGQQCDTLKGKDDPETKQLRHACHLRLDKLQKSLEEEIALAVNS